MQLNLIEEDKLFRLRMLDDRGTTLPNTQAIAVLPLELHRSPATVFFDLRPVVGLKKLLPANIQAGREVAHVHQAFAFKLLADARLQLAVNLAAIDDW